MHEIDNHISAVMWRKYIDGRDLDRIYLAAIGTRDRQHGFWVAIFYEQNELVIEFETEPAGDSVEQGVFYYIPAIDEFELPVLKEHIMVMQILMAVSEQLAMLYLSDKVKTDD